MTIHNSNDNVLNFSILTYSKIKEYIDIIKDDFKNFQIHEEKLHEIINLLECDTRSNVQKLASQLTNLVKSRITEIDRVQKMYNFDKQYLANGYIAGVDEVGRGPLAGPIVAASVILDLNTSSDRDLLLGIKDSKKLTSKSREELSKFIKDKAISYKISLLDNTDIDTKGISWCNNEAFKIAVGELSVKPDLVLSDGYPIKNFNIPNEYVIKGDEKSASIACASIIAKVYRDNLMKEYAKLYPYYSFEVNSGYGTKDHIEAIKTYGPSKIHRLYFLKNIL